MKETPRKESPGSETSHRTFPLIRDLKINGHVINLRWLCYTYMVETSTERKAQLAERMGNSRTRLDGLWCGTGVARSAAGK